MIIRDANQYAAGFCSQGGYAHWVYLS